MTYKEADTFEHFNIIRLTALYSQLRKTLYFRCRDESTYFIIFFKLVNVYRFTENVQKPNLSLVATIILISVVNFDIERCFVNVPLKQKLRREKVAK